MRPALASIWERIRSVLTGPVLAPRPIPVRSGGVARRRR
jgi:hypothetical protein